MGKRTNIASRTDEDDTEQATGEANPATRETEDGAKGTSESRGEKQSKSREELYAALGAVDDPDAEVGDDDPESGTETDTDDDQSDDGQDDSDEASPDDIDESGQDDTDDDSEDPGSEDESEDDETESADEAQLGRIPDEEWSKLSKKTQEQIKKLRGSYKETKRKAESVAQYEKLADYGKSVIEFADQASMTDEDLSQWLTLGAAINRGDNRAVEPLLNLARELGWAPEQVESQGASKDGKLPPKLQKMVDDMEITEAAARELAKELAERESKTPTASQQQEQAPLQAPRLSPNEQAVAEGKKALAERVSAAQTKYGSQWPKLWKQVQKEMYASKGIDPSAWASLFDQSLKLVLERNRRKTPRSAGKGSLSASSKREKKIDPDALTGRERIYAKFTNVRVRPTTK